MQHESRQGFDFDEWSRLARSDPDAFERRRRDAIDFAISRASARSQPRLRRLQWRIDMEIRRAKTPMAACLRVSTMMWDSVVGERGLLRAVEALRNLERPEGAPPENMADVVLFRHRPQPF